MKADTKMELVLPEGVQVTVAENVTVKGPKGEVARKLTHPNVKVTSDAGKVVLESKAATKREKKTIYTFAAHLKNMFKGVTEGHFYELKIKAAHFPMNVSVANNELIVKNFLGENAPRVLKIREGVAVKVEGDVIRIESTNIELAGMAASKIEILTKVKNRDRRIFQDGIFITNKDGKEIV